MEKHNLRLQTEVTLLLPINKWKRDSNSGLKFIDLDVSLTSGSKHTKKTVIEPSSQLQNCTTFKGRMICPSKRKFFFIISVITRVTPIFE